MATTLTRRGFLKAGLIGAVVLAAGGGLYRMTTEAPTRFMLDERAKSILAAIIPVMLKDGMIPSKANTAAAIERVQVSIAGLSLHAQKEIADLFGLLSLAPSRRFLAGVPDDWPQAKPDDVAAFLQSWRVSRIALFQTAYHGLHDLVIGSWYADESTWASIGYPGPIKELS